jgi:hypothetical protein
MHVDRIPSLDAPDSPICGQQQRTKQGDSFEAQPPLNAQPLAAWAVHFGDYTAAADAKSRRPGQPGCDHRE